MVSLQLWHHPHRTTEKDERVHNYWEFYSNPNPSLNPKPFRLIRKAGRPAYIYMHDAREAREAGCRHKFDTCRVGLCSSVCLYIYIYIYVYIYIYIDIDI